MAKEQVKIASLILEACACDDRGDFDGGDKIDAMINALIEKLKDKSKKIEGESKEDTDYMSVLNSRKGVDMLTEVRDGVVELVEQDKKRLPDWFESKLAQIADDIEEVHGWITHKSK